ncbi:FecR family protein [Pedobacter arcticus]|uniref:FecR family protein n=1 Tax=Pedobacter arcticus TaxID=752140 RepID=UPI00031564F2|nr:FecR domain-containing protein [Pedobacter arcticus]
MNIPNSRIFHQILNNTCSPPALDEFLTHIEDDKNKEAYLNLITNALDKDVETALDEQIRLRLNERLNQILAQETKSANRSVKKLQLHTFYKYAAIVFLALSLITGIYILNHKNTISETISAIKPGGNKAILTLANGSKIVLNDIKDGTLIRQAGIEIIKAKDGRLIYNISDEQVSEQNPSSNQYNTLEVPRGGQYQINLSDGTKVWLNSESSLRFKQSFTNLDERKVELSGEAYFEVAKNKLKPFRVMTTNGAGLKEEVQVLGTHFNITSYKDEKTSKTTLLEGSVRVTTASTIQTLKPEQQFVLRSNGFSVDKVDVQEVIAWKNGFFIFENDNLEGVLKKISRWYDVQIVYDGSLNDIKIIGSVSRKTDISEVLNILEKTDKFKFKLEGRRIIVMH